MWYWLSLSGFLITTKHIQWKTIGYVEKLWFFLFKFFWFFHSGTDSKFPAIKQKATRKNRVATEWIFSLWVFSHVLLFVSPEHYMMTPTVHVIRPSALTGFGIRGDNVRAFAHATNVKTGRAADLTPQKICTKQNKA